MCEYRGRKSLSMSPKRQSILLHTAPVGKTCGRLVGEESAAVVDVDAVLAACESAGRSAYQEEIEIAVVVDIAKLRAGTRKRNCRKARCALACKASGSIVDQQIGHEVEVLNEYHVQIAVVVDVAEFNASVQAGQAAGALFGAICEEPRAVVGKHANRLRRTRR